MIIGAAYYPEHWSRNRWERDAVLMKKMGINTIRIGEFGWSVMEREEGKYDFSLYDEATELFGSYGIHTIMGTPTAAPPKWLCDKIPGIYMKDRYGTARGFGTRRHYCYNNEQYREYSARIVQKQAEHFRDNHNIIAWQIDNELGCEDEVRCYCEKCREKFITWLHNKYGSLDEVNRSWGTVFWSQTYTDWDEIILPQYAVTDNYSYYTHNPGLLYDYALFASDSLIDYAKMQTEIIRDVAECPIVHNVVSEKCDNYKLSRLLDRAGYDAYPRSEWDTDPAGRIGFHYALTAGYKDTRMWILEQQSGPCGWNVLGNTPKPGQLALWTIQAALYRAEAIVFFRWRSCLFGAEQFWYGILDHDGIPGKRYEELRKAVTEVQENEDLFSLPDKKEVLLVYDYRNKFSHEIQRHHKDFSYKEETVKIFTALKKLHVQTEIRDGLAGILSEYPVVMLPFCSIPPEGDIKIYEQYVKEGGTLILTPFSGLRTKENQITEERLPGIFREMAGVEITGFFSSEEETTELLDGEEAVIWGELLQPITARSEELYGGDDYCGEVAVTSNSYGKGRVWYIGCLMKDYRKIFGRILEEAGIERPELDEEIEYFHKVSDRESAHILLNHSKEAKRCEVDGNEVLVEGYNYKIIQI